MTKPSTQFLFHVPMTRKVLDYEQLERKMDTRKAPRTVDVIEVSTKKRLGSMSPFAALAKFR